MRDSAVFNLPEKLARFFGGNPRFKRPLGKIRAKKHEICVFQNYVFNRLNRKRIKGYLLWYNHQLRMGMVNRSPGNITYIVKYDHVAVFGVFHEPLTIGF